MMRKMYRLFCFADITYFSLFTVLYGTNKSYGLLMFQTLLLTHLNIIFLIIVLKSAKKKYFLLK